MTLNGIHGLRCLPLISQAMSRRHPPRSGKVAPHVRHFGGQASLLVAPQHAVFLWQTAKKRLAEHEHDLLAVVGFDEVWIPAQRRPVLERVHVRRAAPCNMYIVHYISYKRLTIRSALNHQRRTFTLLRAERSALEGWRHKQQVAVQLNETVREPLGRVAVAQVLAPQHLLDLLALR